MIQESSCNPFFPSLCTTQNQKGIVLYMYTGKQRAGWKRGCCIDVAGDCWETSPKYPSSPCYFSSFLPVETMLLVFKRFFSEAARGGSSFNIASQLVPFKFTSNRDDDKQALARLTSWFRAGTHTYTPLKLDTSSCLSTVHVQYLLT